MDATGLQIGRRRDENLRTQRLNNPASSQRLEQPISHQVSYGPHSKIPPIGDPLKPVWIQAGGRDRRLGTALRSWVHRKQRGAPTSELFDIQKNFQPHKGSCLLMLTIGWNNHDNLVVM